MLHVAAAHGPLWLDLRQASSLTAVRTLEDAMLRMRAGARIVVVRVDDEDVLDAVLYWADELDVPLERVACGDHEELRLYLLPPEFGAHPFRGDHKRVAVMTPVPLNPERVAVP